MPPFTIPNNRDQPAGSHVPTAFATMLRNLRSVARGSSSSGDSSTSPSRDRDKDGRRKLGPSSRGAGVPVKPPKATTPSPSRSPAYEPSVMDATLPSRTTRREGAAGQVLAGPSRGGFIAQASKAAPTVASSPSLPSSPISSKASSISSPLTSPFIGFQSLVSDLPFIEALDTETILPPSKILPRLLQSSQFAPSPDALVPLIRLLATSVSLFPFPPPALAAASLSEALSAHPMSPASERPPLTPPTADGSPRPNPTPLQIYISQSHLLVETSPPAVREAVLELMRCCIEASFGATGGLKETEKAVFWDEVRRWAIEARIEVDSGGPETRWVLPDSDREALVAVLSSLTRGGRVLSDAPGLVALLCAFVTDSLPFPPPPSPLYDPTLETPFIQTIPASPSRHTTSLALLTALHKFSAPHIYIESTLLALKAVLAISKLQEERDIGGGPFADAGVLGFLSAVVRFGEVSGERSRRDGSAMNLSDESMERLQASDSHEGDEILREVVATVARIVGCEGLVGVVEVSANSTTVGEIEGRTRPSVLPGLALELMRDLLRSPANQALKSLRAVLVAPPSSAVLPPAPVLLLVGALRSLRKALMEHSAETESNRMEISSVVTGESRWPSLLSLGLPFLWENLRRVMSWKSAYVDAEVLRLVEERLEASERVGQRMREASSSTAPDRPKEVDEGDNGISYEEWDMAVEVLQTVTWHIGDWEEKNKRSWIWKSNSDDDADGVDDPDSSDDEDEPPRFKQRPGILAAISSLLQKVYRAWSSSDFMGPSERVFTLLVSLAPHLSDRDAHAVIDQCAQHDLCLPSHPEWLDRTQEVVRAFYLLPLQDRNVNSRTSLRVASSATRRRALQLLSNLHSHLRLLDNLRQALVDSVLMPLLEATFETETDVEVVDVLLTLLVEVARDDLPLEARSTSFPSPTATVFDRIRLLLVRVAKGNVRPNDRISSSIKQKRPAGFASLSRYHMDSSTTAMRSSPSISAPVAGSAQPGQPLSEADDVPFLAVLALLSIFHLCLSRSTPASSEKAVLIFRDLLGLLSPSAVTSAADPPNIAVSLRTRVVILQWLVRLRADAAHRIHWVPVVDITGPATILGRLVVPSTSDQATEALTAATGRTSEDGGRPEIRGRTARPERNLTRDPSGSRLRIASEERSPSRGASIRRTPTVAPAPPVLWTLPEVLPFDFGAELSSVGGKGLVSFDHNRMRTWTEEEDPTGMVQVREVEDSTAPEDFMVVLPVSEYLRTINYLLSQEAEWELVSYILCHLPEQLSNKHFACGPRAAQQIHFLRQQLCSGLRGGAQTFLSDMALPPGLKRAEVHATAYLCLASLIAYRSLFSKAQQDELVETFMYGLGNPRDTAKVCIHALAIASFELRPSMRKHLAEIVRHLQKIISSATLGVHILELIAGVGQEPSLYANFTEIDFQTVFGIALKYIQAHNERLLDNPTEASVEDGIEYAFSQYVFLLAYYVIAAWYMALRLSERPKYVPFLTRRLVQANEGKPEIDEPTEVCFDMIARYAYSNADPRPRHSSFDKLISSDNRAGAAPATSKTWIVGTATVTIKSLPSPAWVEVTVRRASGVVRMLWELQNISGVRTSSDADSIGMYLRHRETSHLAPRLPSIMSEALASLPSSAALPPRLGHRARSSTVSGTPSYRPSLEETTAVASLNAAVSASAEPTLESGLLSVDPSFFTLQLSSFPDFGRAPPPLLLPNDPQTQRGISALDRMPVVDFHKVGVLYVGPNQKTEREILCNTHGSAAYIRLISSLGRLVRLQGSRELDIYAGGLDQEADLDGKWTYNWDDDISQIVFHVATLMPTSKETDPQATLKKRHIGNDFVKIVFNDSGSEFEFDTLPGDFNFVNIIIEPHTPAGNPWIAPGMMNNVEFFKVSMQCRQGMPEVGPLGTFKMVTGTSLPGFVRQLSLHSNIFAQVYLASVGFEARQGTQKLEYSSNWRKRLQQVKLLKKRAMESAGIRVSAVSETPVDLDTAETSRLFTNWL